MAEEALLGAFEGRAGGGFRSGIQRAGCAGDVRRPHRRVEIVVNDREGAGIGVIDAPLRVGELVLDQLVFDAVIGERARGVEAERAQVAGEHLHRRDAAGLDRLDELGPGREWEILAAPQAEPLGIGQIVDRGGAGRRDIDDAGAGQRMLEPQPRAPLLRGGDIAPVSFAASGILHGVAFIENDRAVEVGAEPFDDLPDARRLLAALVGPQRGIGGEQDAFLKRDRTPLRKARQRRHQQALHAERRPVTLRVLDQLVGLGDPDGLAAPAHPVVEDDGGRLAAFASTGAVAEHEATPEADRALRIVRRRSDEIEGLIDRPGAGEVT